MRGRNGFTLIELLVVVAIIGLLAGIILFQISAAREKGRIASAKGQLHEINSAIEIMVNDTNQWPGHKSQYRVEATGGTNEVWNLTTSAAGLLATDGTYAGWHGPYLSEVPIDPWGHPYFLDTDYMVDDEEHPCQGGGGGCHNVAALGSFGPNGVGQNVYDSDDIIFVMGRQ